MSSLSDMYEIFPENTIFVTFGPPVAHMAKLILEPKFPYPLHVQSGKYYYYL